MCFVMLMGLEMEMLSLQRAFFYFSTCNFSHKLGKMGRGNRMLLFIKVEMSAVFLFPSFPALCV